MTRSGKPTKAPEYLTLPQAAEQLGVNPADLAGFIREAGLEPSGPESEWRLEAADVQALKAERHKVALQNKAQLERAAEKISEQ